MTTTPTGSRIPYPDDEYVALIGRLAYVVTYLEGGILFDLSKHASALPSQLQVEELVKQTTGGMAGCIRDHIHKVTDAKVETWLRAAGQHLGRAADKRNKVLHGRPANIGGVERLRYWRPDKQEDEVITVAFLTEAIEEVEQAVHALELLRV